ncbi:MAG TPA: hypothetical protein H9870_10495 [Candidatus Corynebacterium avicola]|uniref:Uncharacterized protein n=1 Tax=Candidatus Corynebacterium avicola TaxID=2838527 RepID=A0A9D1RPD6_9CORY|nr:hypothetical protein [Candidatus Corynebacterium avicola]
MQVSPLCLPPECTPTDWYRNRISWRHKKRRNPLAGHRPLTRGELIRNGITRTTIRDNYTRVEYGVYLDNDSLLPATTDTGYTRSRRIPAAMLTLAHLIRHPHRIATGFGAASLYGMTYFVEEELLEFLAPPGSSPATAPDHVQVCPTRHHPTHVLSARSLDGDIPGLRVAPTGTTLSHMFRQVMESGGIHDALRAAPDLTSLRPELSPKFIKCVQVSDSFHQALGRVEPGNPAALRVPGGVDARLAAKIIDLTDVGAESPPESLLRLVVSDLASGLRSQIPVFKEDGSLLTVSDLGWEEPGVHLFYDGVHHLHRHQRDHDSKVLAALQRNGGHVIRVIAEDLNDLDAVIALRERISEALG